MYPPSDHTATQGQRATQTPRRTKGRAGGSGGAQTGGQELGVRRKGVVQLGAERGPRPGGLGGEMGAGVGMRPKGQSHEGWERIHKRRHRAQAGGTRRWGARAAGG